MKMNTLKFSNWNFLFTTFLSLLFFNINAQTALDLSNDTRGNDINCDPTGNTFTGCGSVYTDDGGVDGLYNDYLADGAYEGPFVWTFCPDAADDNRVRLIFSEFDIASDDSFTVYEGSCEELTDGISITGNAVGSMIFSPATGYNDAGTLAVGTGWIEATCASTTGCISIAWTPNRLNTKGNGWVFTVDCAARNAAITSPFVILPKQLLTDCDAAATISIPAPTFENGGCASYSGGLDTGMPLVTTIPGPYIIEVLHNGLSTGFWEIDEFLQGNISIENVSVGTHTVEYVLYYVDVSGNRISKDNATGTYIIEEVSGLVGNDNITKSIESDCSALINIDDLLEGNGNASSYNGIFTISITGPEHTSSGPKSNPSVSINTMGTYAYNVSDACGNAVSGTIIIEDLQGPVCPDLAVHFIGCGEIPPAEAPLFVDCNGIAAASYSDLSYGECRNFTTAERDALIAIGYTEAAEWEAVGNSFILPVIAGGSDYAFSVRVRSWEATDALGNKTEGCKQIFVNVSPETLTPPTAEIIEVNCEEGTTPSELVALNRFAATDIAPNFSVTVPETYSLQIGVGALSEQSGIVLPDNQSLCGWVTSYEDEEIDGCGSSKKIIRAWKWLDWCAVTPVVFGPFMQVIEIVDNKESVLVSGPNAMKRSTEHFGCQADVSLGAASWTDGCGEIAAFKTEIIKYYDADGDNAITKLDIDDARAAGNIFWKNNTNGGDFANIPLGTYWVVYFAIDECGNETSRLYDEQDPDDLSVIPANIYSTTLSVIDDVRPLPQCDDIIIALGPDWGRIDVAAIEESSYDNCGIVSMGVSLVENEDSFTEFIQLDCDDIQADLIVYLQATDNAGNTNICWGYITVEDKIAPTCSPPADMSVACDFAHISEITILEGAALNARLADLFGTATCSDNEGCNNNITIAQSIEVDESGCGNATITRTFIATDGWGHEASPVTQTITANYIADWTLTFPESGTVTCSDAANGGFGAAANEDEILTAIGFCDRLSVNVEEQVFNSSSDACVKVVRTYTVWNECGTSGLVYNANTEGVRIIENGDTDAQQIVYTQTISAAITEGPEIQLDPIDTNIYGAVTKDGNTDCTEARTIIVRAEDCLGFDVLDDNITWTVEGATGTISGTGPSIVFDAAPGAYNLSIWASDGCGNSNGVEENITFVDAKAPGIWLYSTLSTQIMPAIGSIDIWADDFIGAVVDCDAYTTGIWHQSLGDAPANCDDVAALDQNVVFDCNHVGTQIVRIYGVDATGNCDYVETAIIIQDNGNTCGGDIIEEAQAVVGKITNPAGEYVEVVNVSVNGGMSSAMTTDNSGSFAFTVPTGGDYTITPEKDINHLNGVSTFDLVLISKHILNIQNFTSPYEYIAADINKSGTVTAFDMVELRQLILNINTEFANNTSWRFVDAVYNFGPLTTTLSQNFPEIANINNIASDQTNVDFIAVKIGDINASAVPASRLSNDNSINLSMDTLTLTEDALLTSVVMPVKVDQFEKVEGLQFSVNWDPSILRYAGHNLFDLPGNIGTTNVIDGKLIFSWTNETRRSKSLPSNSEILEIEFIIKKVESTDINLEDINSGFNNGIPTIKNEVIHEVESDRGTTVTISTPITYPGRIIAPATSKNCLAMSLSHVANSAYSGIYRAENTITSKAVLNAGSLTYYAGQSITLNPGFHVKANSTFLATIESCAPNLQDPNTPDVIQLKNSEESGDSISLFQRVEPINTAVNLMVFPNPSKTYINIAYDLEESGIVTIKIMDVRGKIMDVILLNQQQNRGVYQTHYNINYLENGMYLVQLSTKAENVFAKVLVAK